MYCLQWLIPVLLIPKPVNPALLYNHAVLMVLYLTGFFLERKPCTICSVVFAVALALVWSSSGYTLNCVLFGEDCSAEEMDSAVAIYSNCCDKYHDKDVCDAMRINERALATYSVSSATPVDRAGWLWKRGEMNRSFQRRWFVLRGNLLFYFEKKSERSDPAGVIVLEGCTVELAEEEQEKPYAFKIAFHGEGKRTYIAATESQEDLEEWMKIVACASFDYMKLMVVELQQQLAELEEAERAAAAATATAAASAVADEADAEPKPPPRQRANPFNNQTKSPVKRQTWISLHTDTGAKIRSDRVAWQSEKKASSS